MRIECLAIFSLCGCVYRSYGLMCSSERLSSATVYTKCARILQISPNHVVVRNPRCVSTTRSSIPATQPANPAPDAQPHLPQTCPPEQLPPSIPSYTTHLAERDKPVKTSLSRPIARDCPLQTARTVSTPCGFSPSARRVHALSEWGSEGGGEGVVYQGRMGRGRRGVGMGGIGRGGFERWGGQSVEDVRMA